MLNLTGSDTITTGQVGLLAGYNLQFGRFVVGVQADVAYQGNKKNKFSEIVGTPVRDEVQIDWTGHLLLRLGLDINGWLPYVMGGAVGARVEAAHIGFITPTDTFRWSKRSFRIAKSYGGGIEKQLANGWSVRGEYLYDYWSAKHYDWVEDVRYSDIGLTIHNVRLAVTKRFGGAPAMALSSSPPPPPPPPAIPPPATVTCPDGTVILTDGACPAPPPPPLPPAEGERG